MNRKIHLIDTTMRDGSHAVSHSFTKEQVRMIARGLDDAGVDIIEISHGDGLAGSSINYGFSHTGEMELIKEASHVIKRARLGALLLPGIGTIRDLEEAYDNGVTAVRVATHVTEADIAIQHIKAAKERNMFTVGFLMMTHMASPEKILEQARIFEDCGVDYVNLADSAGHLLPDEVKERISLLNERLSVPVGFHAHNNMGLAIANSIAAIEEGAQYIDITCRGLGAGAGNCQGEVFAAVLNRLGYETGVDLFKILDVAEKIVDPIMQYPQIINTDSLMLGYVGVYSSFLLHAKRAAKRFDLDAKDILIELGRRQMVGGQEDMIVDVAYMLSQKKKAGKVTD
jgi:4-hydroxy 2-oxovalerate aldolase